MTEQTHSCVCGHTEDSHSVERLRRCLVRGCDCLVMALGRLDDLPKEAWKPKVGDPVRLRSDGKLLWVKFVPGAGATVTKDLYALSLERDSIVGDYFPLEALRPQTESEQSLTSALDTLGSKMAKAVEAVSTHFEERRKPSNPKEQFAVGRVYFSVVPTPVVAEIALGMLEGGVKYGSHNYREMGVKASTYYDAAIGHLSDWWEGEDIDEVSTLNHVTKALSSLTVLRDAMLNDMLTDDRPLRAKQGWRQRAKEAAKSVLGKFEQREAPYTEVNRGKPR